MASRSTGSLLVLTSAKQTILTLCLAIDRVAHAVVLKDNVIVFAPSGPRIGLVDIAPPAPRCVLSRRS